MKITINLPEASITDAAAFGLWLQMLISDAEPQTVIGEIRVEQ